MAFKEASPAINSTWITNQAPPPRNEVASDHALPHTKKQFAAAEHIKEKLTQSIATKRTTDHDRTRALRDETQLRLILALLQCPDLDISGLAFAPDRDILKDNQFLCAKAKELVELWMGPFDKASSNVVPGYRCVFTHNTVPVEAAHVIPEHITRLDGGSPLQLEAFTTLLGYLFPANVIDDRVIKDLLSGAGLPNIIPLYMSFHAVWDTCSFILRPITREPGEADDKGRSMKLQFLNFSNEDPVFANCIYDVTAETEQADCQRRLENLDRTDEVR
ncbi:hypothetical protein PG993_005742 [Apiospora rasikravindrae]|uniref:HNH nuclease domain-containing protein n=1 Tax=Apiospora rasikravindrae TaxID=990691 RepID=A0ABR1TA93_9PEZI